MFQRVIRTLKQKELLTPTVFILALLVVLSLIIILGQFFHQSLQEEMAGQFNQQQLLLAREVAINIESFIDHAYKDITVISRMPEIQRIDQSSSCRPVAEAINFNIQNEALVTIRVLNKTGVVKTKIQTQTRQGGSSAVALNYLYSKAGDPYIVMHWTTSQLMAKSSSGRTEPSLAGRSRTCPKLARTS